jgi:GntR family transcriptional regulator
MDIGVPLARDDLESYPIFDLLETKYGVALSAADYRIEAANASSRVARHLRIKTNDAILLIDRTTYSSSGRAVDYEQLHYRGDRARYRLRLNR